MVNKLKELIFSYAELGTMIPGSGGEGQYLSKGFGPLMAFLFNWTSILILKPGTIAILCVATSSYILRMFFNIFNTTISGKAYFWIEKALAIAFCLLVSIISVISIKWADRIKSILTVGKIIALAMILFSGLYYAIFVDSSIVSGNLRKPFAGSIWTVSGLALTLNNGIWSYEGWNNLNLVAGYILNPSRTLPLSIWISMVGVICLYLLTLLGYYTVLPKALIGMTNTVGIDFGRQVFGITGSIIMPILIASSTFSSALASMITSSEIVLLAAEYRQIPVLFMKISPTFGTAARAYWMQGFLSTILVLMSSFDKLIVLYTFPTWIFYGACILVLLKLRYYEPKLARPYRVFLSTPIIFLVACVFLFISSAIAEPIPVVASVGVVFLGIPLYYLLKKGFGFDLEINFNQREDINKYEKVEEIKE